MTAVATPLYEKSSTNCVLPINIIWLETQFLISILAVNTNIFFRFVAQCLYIWYS